MLSQSKDTGSISGSVAQNLLEETQVSYVLHESSLLASEMF